MGGDPARVYSWSREVVARETRCIVGESVYRESKGVSGEVGGSEVGRDSY